MALSEQHGKILLDVVRTTVEHLARTGEVPPFYISDEALLVRSGVFVTIHKLSGMLRGCIGVFESDKPLYETVVEMAVSSSTGDPRFAPVSAHELPELTYEISVLTPMREVTDVSEIEVGTHGIYIIKGAMRGVLLPQVATEHGFDRETFLDETCVKAGLHRGAWKEEPTKILIFEAEIFSEGE